MTLQRKGKPMIIDMHAHLWESEAGKCKSDILGVCHQFNVSRVMVSSLGGYYPDEDEIDRMNRLTYEFMKEQPGLVEGYSYLNPRHRSAVDRLRHCIEDYEMCGVKLWVATFCDDLLVNPIMEQAIKYNIPVLIHAFHKAVDQLEFESLGQNVANIAGRYPEAKIIMAHLGANCLRELRPIINCLNVSVDFSGSISRCDDVLYAKKLLGADRILFGSDMPGLSFLVSYGQILEADLTGEERDKILYKNTLKLFERS